ncbi:MAG: hypothetical protein M1839_004621 [Geoglossum umbratile]|nr:MAG: hypothetical protein M1839_004621 [Geoglossum umbratile]
MFHRPQRLEGPALAIADFERAMEELFLPAKTERFRFADSHFDTISRLLSQVGKPQWSQRPRTYAVLRMIGRVDLFDAFVLDGLKDITFPYADSRLPASLSPTAKAQFLQAQKMVLTKASDLEKSDGRHRHLDLDADAHFYILRILGRGAFGEVDHVRSKLSLEEYARKRVYRGRAFSRDREAVKMFENELTNLKRLSHRHLVKFVGSYTDPKFVGLLISPVADCDLKAFLERDPFPSDDLYLLRGFFGCLCSAVLYLHSSQCRHKDLKPGNVLVYMKKVLITDFGTARDWSEQSRSTTIGRGGVYTPGYAAPEVVDQEPRSSSADIWSLGCIYLDMATVLRGETMAGKNGFFSENGTGGANPRSNSKALELWLVRLKSETDEQPLEWIKQMIRNPRNDRVTAAGLMSQIHSYEDEHVYYSSCCNGEEESETGTSYQGSVFEGDASVTKDSGNSIEPRVEVANGMEVPIRRGQLPVGSVNSEDQIETETAFQRLEGVDAKDNGDRRTALHQTASGRPRGPSPSIERLEVGEQPPPLHRMGESRDFIAIGEANGGGRAALHQDTLGGQGSPPPSIERLEVVERPPLPHRVGVSRDLISIGEANGDGRATLHRVRSRSPPLLIERPIAVFPLHHAAATGNLTAIEELLEGGWGVDLKNVDGDTPLDAAVKSNEDVAVALLLTRGARACSGSAKNQIRSWVESGLVRASRMREVREWLAMEDAGRNRRNSSTEVAVGETASPTIATAISGVLDTLAAKILGIYDLQGKEHKY